MPSVAKGPAKSEHSKERPKRKRVELEVDAAWTEKVSTEPSKKLRKNNAMKHATRPSGKQTKEKKVIAVPELVEAFMEQTGEQIQKKVKTKRKIGNDALEARLQTHPAVPQTLLDGATKRAEELTDIVALKDNPGTRKASKRLVDFDEVSAKPSEKDTERAEALEAEEEEIHLQGFSSESDSSDEEMNVADAPPLDFSTLPAFSKDDAVVQRRLEKAKRHPTEDKGVLYLGRIPHGFYEDQMRGYFSQFGDVTRLRLSRNKKTGRSKHYAFIEFSSSAVADIVSETMHNYLLLGHILQCKVIPKDQVHPELWVGATKKWRLVPRDRLALLKQNKPRSREEQQRAESRLVARQRKKQAKIHELGIDYDLDDVAYKTRPKA